MNIRIFKLGDYDWYAAETLDQAWAEMLSLVGEEATAEAREWGHIELQQEDMDTTRFICDDTQEERSFTEELARLIAEDAKFPRMFATSEI